jgi:hypothetical protein
LPYRLYDTAAAGTVTTLATAGRSTSTLANMPGRRLPSSLGKRPCTATMPVLASISGSIAWIVPAKLRPGQASVVMRIGWPMFSNSRSFCDTEKFTSITERSCRFTIA